MVMTSDQIASQSMAFQQQVMMQNQYAGMLSQNAGSAPMGERMMGNVANRGMGIGSAVLGGGLALAGMDPMSLAAKAGMGAWAGGAGIAGAAGAAAGAFLPAYALYQAGSYAGGQIMQGMGQQQALNATLRQNFQFMGQTGRGFNAAEMGGIGGMLRDQTAFRGPGGEFATMDELTRLAGNMGRMGLAQGVRSAKEFSQKFQEMMTTVKEIATTFSTSLESAQQVMVGMRQSGIFNNQAQVANQIRQISQAGGMATSEVTGMMTVGSQISRMIGGRGQAGAMGGMKTIAQIGIAQQAGLLSEEQLYNLTGQEGAEGRRALATEMMQRSAQFLQGGRGRAFLASIAGKGGTLDEASVQAYMYGGMSTGETMGSAHQNIAKMGGAAAFLRHQGKLRGEALGRFGGLTDVMAMRGWLQGRGLNLDPSDDRSMLFMQRQMGMSTEMAEFSLEQMRNLPELIRQQQAAGEQDTRLKNIERHRGTMGVAGVKKSLEGFKHGIDKALQKTGSDLYQWGSNVLEREINRLTHDYVQFIEKDVGEAARDSIQETVDPFKRARLSKFGMGDYARTAQMNKLGEGVNAINLGGKERRMTEEGAAAYGRAGYEMVTGSGFFGGWTREDSTRAVKLADRAQSLETSYYKGLGGTTELGAESKRHIQALMTSGAMVGGGEGRVNDLIEKLRGPGTPKELRELAERAQSGGANVKAALMGTVLRQSGMGDVGDALMATPKDAGSLMWSVGGARTETDLYAGIGEYAFKAGTHDRAKKEARLSQLLQAQSRSTIMRGGVAGGVVQSRTGSAEIAQLQKELSGEGKLEMGNKDVQIAYGQALMEEESGKRALAVTGADMDVVRDTEMSVRAEYSSIEQRAASQNRELSLAEKGRMGMLADLAATADYNQLTKGGTITPSAEEEAAFRARNNGRSLDEIKSVAGVMVERGDVRRREALKETWKYNREMGRDWQNRMAKGGVTNGDSLSNMAKERLIMASGGLTKKQAQAVIEGGAEKTFGAGIAFAESFQAEAKARAGIIEDPQTKEAADRNETLRAQAGAERKKRADMMATWDEATAKRMGKTLLGTAGMEELGGEVMERESMRKRARGLMAAGGSTQDITLRAAKMLGVKGLSSEDLKDLDPEAMAGRLAGGMGLGAEKGKELAEAIKQVRSGDKTEVNKGLATLSQAEKESQRVKSEKEAQNDPTVLAIKDAMKGAMEKLSTNGIKLKDGGQMNIGTVVGVVTTTEAEK